MTQLLDLPQHEVAAGGLTAQYFIISNDTIIHRFDAVDSTEARRIRDADYPGCELGLLIYEGKQWR